jgi:hypothetical protein
MAIARLSEGVIQKVSGPSWKPLKQTFLDMSETLLNAAPNGVGVLTTIYVKYQTTSDSDAGVFAVAWLKTSKQIVLGLALPENCESPLLGPPPVGMQYKGLTKYLTIKPGESLPSDLGQWAKVAVDHTSSDVS